MSLRTPTLTQFQRLAGRISGLWLRAGTVVLLAHSVVACGAGSSSGGSASAAQAGEANGEGGRSAHADAGGGVSGSGARDSSGGQAGSAGLDKTSGGAGAPACPGTTPPTPTTRGCRSQADCLGAQVCLETHPTGAGACGACFATILECGPDKACAADEVCVTDPNPNPCQCMGPSTSCLPKCDANSCLASEVCGADGRCAPKSCADGYSCPSGTLCDPTRAGDTHQCAPARCDFAEISCAADEVCDPASTLPASHCRAKRCTEGATCPTNRTCSPSGSCERLKCTTDSDCECGVCIGGVCHNQLLMCVFLPA